MSELIVNPKSSEMNLGIWAMAATAFLWSIAGLFIKVIDWNPFAIAGVRSLISSLVILVYLQRPKFHWSFPQVGAALAQAATMLLFVAANKTTTAANAILLQYVGPVFTAIIGAWMLKEKAHWEHWVAFLFVGAGMVLLFLDKLGGGRPLGNILALLSGLVFSFYYIFMRMQKDSSPLESILLAHWLTAAIGLGVALFLPRPVFTWQAAGAIALLGVFQVGVAAILFTTAIKRIPAVFANLIAVIEPVFNPLWVFLALGEAPGFHAIIGGMIIVMAVTGASIISARRSS
ncbi:MAG: DMT family transporter [Candidatus Aminicenantes bacterium]|nr:DMT family transporter [Candidatus Aminicenantes bacterium]